MTPSAMTDPAHRSRAGMLAATGLALCVLGVVGYFALVMGTGARLPSIRNHAIPNWILVAFGLALSVLASPALAGACSRASCSA
jgi:hypothetical protein